MHAHSSHQMKGAKFMTQSHHTVKLFYFLIHLYGYYKFWNGARVVTKYWTGIRIQFNFYLYIFILLNLFIFMIT